MKPGIAALPSLLLALCLAGPAAAQSVRATLVEAESGAPVDEALITLADSSGAVVDVDLSDAQGAVSLTAPDAGRYRLLVERIGFATGTTPLFDLSTGEPLALRVPVPVRPVELAALIVETDAVCRPDRVGDRPAAVLWEEARKALDRVVWSRARGDLRFDVRLFERRLSQRGRVLDEEAREVEVRGIRPFDTVPAEDLATHGFIRAVEDDTLYFGPDAEVLLSAAFARTHCFRSVAGKRAGRIGLAFEPLDPEASEIEGVLWLDESTAELRELEFAYTGPIVSSVGEEHRGRMAFQRLASGHWIVDEWSIRLPRYTRPLILSGRGTRHASARRRLRHVGWWERGGKVESVEEPAR